MAFLRVKEETIRIYHQNNNLKTIGLCIIKSLFQKRNQKNGKYRQGDSPLRETKYIEYINNEGEPTDVFYNIGEEDLTFEDEAERKTKERQLDTMNALIIANRENQKIQLLLMCTNNHGGITETSKEMNTSIYLVRKELSEIKQTLKEYIK